MLGSCFYQKDFAPDGPPSGTPRLRLRAASTGKDVHYLVGGSRATLAAMVNLGCIAIHVMSTRASNMRDADWLAFDLDPSSGEFADAARAGLALRPLLDDARLTSFPKTSGSRGLHVFVPLRAGQSLDEARRVAVAIGEELARREPKLVTVEHRKSVRGGRVFADAFRNGYGQTIVPPYSVRRRPPAAVSPPRPRGGSPPPAGGGGGPPPLRDRATRHGGLRCLRPAVPSSGVASRRCERDGPRGHRRGGARVAHDLSWRDAWARVRRAAR